MEYQLASAEKSAAKIEPPKAQGVEDLVYPRERTVGTLLLIMGVLCWLTLVAGTLGLALLVLGLGFVAYLFAHSALIAHVKGNGVQLSSEQFPDIYKQFVECCERLRISPRPEVYVLNGDGGLNAFATRFLGTEFVILLSNVVDAMEAHPDGVRFYLGHELGHLKMRHLTGMFWRWPVAWLPLLGAAYSRARESTCDRHGKACCASPENAARALAALSAGVERWKSVDLSTLIRQTRDTSDFWMSFHELNSGYPWLTKRVARVLNADAKLPGRHGFAYVLSAFLPYAGRMGPGFGLLMLIYTFGVVAAVAIPAFVTYTRRSLLDTAVVQSETARDALGAYYEKNQQVPETLESLGLETKLAVGATLAFDPEEMVLTVHTDNGELVFTPKVDEQNRVTWSCTNGEDTKEDLLPDSCKTMAEEEE